MKTKGEVVEGIISRFRSEIENVWNNGFAIGEKEASNRIRQEAYQEGFNDGFKHCLSENDFNSPCVSCDGYQRGLSDAWEAAMKIVVMKQIECCEAFGFEPVQYIDSFQNQTPQEAIERLKAYEEKQKSEEKTVVTNRMKFEEVFGMNIRCNTKFDKDERAFVIGNPQEPWRLKYSGWLDLPWKEPEKCNDLPK